MKAGEYAMYMGKEYTSGRIGDKLILRSGSLEDLEKGFELCEPFIYGVTKEKVVCRKYVDPSEVEDYYVLHTRVLYAGYEFCAVEETDDEIAIDSMGGDYRTWLDLGMKCVDKGVYQKWIKKSEAEIKVIKNQLKR